MHLHRDLDKLKKEILILGSLAEDALASAILALRDRRPNLAKEVQDGDQRLDEREIRIEEECLKILALHQPVATDLRFVVAVMKVNNDLERVGDLAGNLAARAAYLAQRAVVDRPPGLERMADAVPAMLRKALESLVRLDTLMARQVLKDDQEIDATHSELYADIAQRMRDAPDEIDELMQLLSTSRYLERIADLATNIAEDVIFMVDGDVVRHRTW
ncbi:MAG: phosphate signaling complex protein PhoU [Acidobacteriota bacterium]